jgi:hypothetical protein
MREIRPSGSVRGVRRKPYPYRDTLTPDAVGGALLTFSTSRPVTRQTDPAKHPGTPVSNTARIANQMSMVRNDQVHHACEND